MPARKHAEHIAFPAAMWKKGFLMRILVRIMLAALVLGGIWFPASTSAAAPTVQPDRGPQGTLFTFTADGFDKDERVSFWVNTPDGKVIGDNSLAVRSSDGGTATWKWTAPADAAFGRWEMIASGNSSRHAVQIPFVVERPADNPPPTFDPGVTPSSGPPTTTFRFTNSGFRGGEEVSFWVTAPNGTLYPGGSRPYNKDYVFTANGDGTAAWAWAAPEEATPGIYLMVAQGAQSQQSVVIRFTIEQAAAAPIPTAPTASPAAGPAGTTFTFAASGYNARERVSYWLDPPNGAPFGDGSYYVTSTGAGVATVTWTAPADAAPGTWSMIIHGLDSRYSVQIPFTITQ